MDLKNIGIGALVNTGLTIILSLIFLPLALLGPLTGGFLAAYLTKRFEDSGEMEEKDGAVVGTISGIIGGLIIGLLLILGLGDISALTDLISSQIGTLGDNFLVMGYIILQLSVIISLVLGLVGGVLGVIVKR